MRNGGFLLDEDGNLIMPQERNKYVMTERDYTSLQKVLSVKSLRICSLTLDCVVDVTEVYHSFIESTNNKFDMFSFKAQSCLLKSIYSYGNLRHNHGYSHLVKVGSISDFNIVDFVQKFGRTPARYFGVLGCSDEKWSEMKISCEQFTESRKKFPVHVASNPR